MQTNYHTQHAPFGAFASFTIGLHNAPGGFGQSLTGPAGQNIYVGYRAVPDGEWKLLPFFKVAESKIAAFTGEQSVASAAEPFPQLREGEFERQLGWASDTWRAGPFSFAIFSPFDHVPEPETLDGKRARFLTAPVLVARVGYDNSEGLTDVEIIFGMSDPALPARPLADTDSTLCGAASGRSYGYATRSDEGVRTITGLSVLRHEFSDAEGFHRLGNDSAILATVPAGTKRVVPIALGFYDGGLVTTGLDCSYFYTRYFSNLEEVLHHGLSEHDAYTALADQRDKELSGSALSTDQQWLVAQATHSYYGSSELLSHEGRPLWIVNEGEYRMMNTFDLTVDHLFFELEWHPWAMRNALDLFTERYSYRDSIKSLDGRKADGGISFTHDIGIANQFAPPGKSTYECTNVDGCFSHMTMEQLVNWVCCAVSYAVKTGDQDWLRSSGEVLVACRQSLEQRDDPDPKQRDGLLKWDSDRCGTGTEITTYDSLDISLGQARNNLYLGTKTLAAWLLLERAFAEIGLPKESQFAADSASRLSRTLTGFFEEETGFFPAVFEKGNRSRILPAVEGLVFPIYLGMTDVLARFPDLLARFETHLKNALRPGVCLDPKSGGWKISSTSHNSWFSKIALAQHVTRVLFPEAMSPEAAAADASHVAWEQGPGCGPWAMCDQVHSENGTAIGSKYYPRCVTAFLWLSESRPQDFHP